LIFGEDSGEGVADIVRRLRDDGLRRVGAENEEGGRMMACGRWKSEDRIVGDRRELYKTDRVEGKAEEGLSAIVPGL
jgi:hypothetical protein